MKKQNSVAVKYLRRNDAGMTLIELVFAAGVVAVALSTMIGALLTLTVMGDVAEGRTRAMTALASVTEEARAAGPEALTRTPAPIVVDGKTLAVAMEVMNPNGENMDIPLALDENGNMPDLPDPLEIEVTVMWEDTRGRVYTTRTAMILGN